ncbi:MAG: helix-turn-helix domain-containing protein [Sutterellaceae bacterium]|nr:helix-turn-helix domain-containing protein [Sutterellaceae bacterium]
MRKVVNDAQLELFAENEEPEVASEEQSPAKEDPRPAFELVAPMSVPTDYRTPHSHELLEAAIELFSRGVSYKTAAYSLGISVYTAREWQHRYRNHTLEKYAQGVTVKGKYPDAIKQQVVRMRVEQGMSYNRIVQETGISRATIRSWLADAGQDDSTREMSGLVDKGVKETSKN